MKISKITTKSSLTFGRITQMNNAFCFEMNLQTQNNQQIHRFMICSHQHLIDP